MTYLELREYLNQLPKEFLEMKVKLRIDHLRSGLINIDMVDKDWNTLIKLTDNPKD